MSCVALMSILSDPVFLSSDFDVKATLLTCSTDTEASVPPLDLDPHLQALDIMNTVLKRSVESWVKSAFASDVSGSGVFDSIPAFNPWLSELVAREQQLAVDAALRSAVDVYVDLHDNHPETLSQIIADAAQRLASSQEADRKRLGDDRKAGMEMCRLRRAGLLTRDVLNATLPSSTSPIFHRAKRTPSKFHHFAY